MGAGWRWLVAVVAALACSGGCWAGLAAARVLDTGSQIGLAAVPLAVVLAVLGPWAERGREKKKKAAPSGELASASTDRSSQVQVTGQVSGGVVIGPGASLANPVFNLGVQERQGKEPLRDRANDPGGVLVVGDVPQQPAAFQLRAGLMEVLERGTGPRVSVVFAVTGMRGVGKTQVAAAYARRRIAERWRLVAWVNASDTASVLAGLVQVADAVGIGAPGQDATMLGVRVRHWLEGDGERRLVVLDNATDLDGLRPFLPSAGAAQVVITSNRQSAGGLGTSVPVDVFTENEALAFLAERTRLDEVVGARKLARELGFLPLGLAQAAALIAREHLSYERYQERLLALPLTEYLGPVEGDPYPYKTAEAIMLSLQSAEDTDLSGRCAKVMGLVSVLAETGISRPLLHLAASDNASGDGAAELDAAAGVLADASLVEFSVNDAIVAHRLVMRVKREELIFNGTLLSVAAEARRLLARFADQITDAWRDPAGVRELASQVEALTTHLQGHLGASVADEATELLWLRLASVAKLNTIGDVTGQAIQAAEPLVADFAQILGADHPGTLTVINNLAFAYRAVGRTAEAIPLYEQVLADRERVLGPDHPSTLSSRLNLTSAYRDSGRAAEVIPLLERTAADYERVLGADHQETLTARNNLAAAFIESGRTAEVIPLLERTVADRERVLGADHPDTLRSRDNLAGAYQYLGETAVAIPMLEQTVATRERVLGADHPETLRSRNNLASAYVMSGRTTKGMFTSTEVVYGVTGTEVTELPEYGVSP